MKKDPKQGMLSKMQTRIEKKGAQIERKATLLYFAYEN